MRRAWYPQQPVESIFKQIHDCADYYEAGGVIIGNPYQINVGYAKIFSIGHFMSACCRWNEKPYIEKTWAQFKAHFAAAHRHHNHMQGESAATQGYHVANSAVGQTEDKMDEATIGALANLATATATDRVVEATLTEANARLVKQLVPCPVRDLVDMVDIILINYRRTLFPLSGTGNAALGPFYLVFLLYEN
jgi:hypothetical protein